MNMGKEKLDRADSVMVLEVPKGTRDRHPIQMKILEELFSTITQCFKRHNALTIDTPVFEKKEVLANKYGEDSNLIYNLKDQGGELLSLRYDLTVPFARYIAMHQVKSLKIYHIGKVYRGDRPTPTRGRFREFYQCDFDIAGDYGPMLADVECLRIIYEILSELALGDFVIKVNHRQLLSGLFIACGVPHEKISAACFVVDKLDKTPWEEVEHELVVDKGLSKETTDKIGCFVQLSGGSDLLDRLEADEGLSKQDKVKDALVDLRLLLNYCAALGIANRIRFDLSLARGMDYYTGVIYEAVLTGFVYNHENELQTNKIPKRTDGIFTAKPDTKKMNKKVDCQEAPVQDEEPLNPNVSIAVGSVAGGGRYDGLVQIFDPFGKQVPCVGVSFGIERFLAIMEALAISNQGFQKQNFCPTETDVMVINAHHGLIIQKLECCRLLWDARIKATLSHKNYPELLDQLQYCESTGIPLAVILEDNELARGMVKIYHIKSKSEHVVNYTELVDSIKCLLGSLKQIPNT